MIGADVNIGETLVVPQQHVEPRLKLLDQVVFEQQRLCFGRRHRHIDVANLAQHPQGLGRLRPALEITADPAFEVPGFTDIQHFIIGPQHSVNTGFAGQAGQERLRIKRGFGRFFCHCHTRAVSSQAGQRFCPPEYRQEHARVQPACLGVVAAAMIRVHQVKFLQAMFGAVGKGKGR